MIGKVLSTAASLAVLLLSLPHVTSFATKPFRVTSRTNRNLSFHQINNAIQFTTPRTTSLSMSKKNEDPSSEGGYQYSSYVNGTGTGWYLLAFALLVNVWFFSIPPEFRRARLCNEEEVVLYADKNCMTGDQWVKGVQEYYQNGGGIHFDFSIEGK